MPVIVLKKDLIVNHKKYLKSYEGKINANFHNNAIPKGCSHCFFLSVILIDFVLKMGKNFYTQVFSDEYIYTAKEKKVRKY